LLSDRDVERILSMEECIDVVEEAFRNLGLGNAVMPLRTIIPIEEFNGVVLIMPSYIKGLNALATKIVAFYPDNARFKLPVVNAYVIVNNPKTGVVEAVIEANHLTAMRTGAVSGVATKYLAREDAKVLAIIGCGVQARTQLWAVATVRSIEKVNVYDVDEDRREEFAREMRRRFQIEVIPTRSAEEAVREADIVVTATTSSSPVISYEWIKPGTHINAIGAFRPDMREIDSKTILNAKVVVDLREAALKEAGDIIIPIQEGLISINHIYAELSDIVLKKKPGRTSNSEITVFKSVGLAIQDSSVANHILNKIMKK
jgi:ornithine cyclodeaminase/alanine dehydrogenase